MNNLDKKIKAWEEQTRPRSSKDQETLTANILNAIRSQTIDKRLQPRKHYYRQLIWTRWALAFALILLMVNIFHPISGRFGPSKRTPEKLLLSSKELNEIRTVYNELNIMFPEGIQWISKTGANLDIHPGQSRAIRYAKNRSDVLITFHVIQKVGDTRSVIQRQDIMVRDGEPIDKTNGMKLALWTHQIDKDLITIELDRVFMNKNIHIRIQDQFLQTFGEQNLISTAQVSGKEYEIYQTAYLF